MQSSQLLRTQPDWVQEAHNWIADQLMQRGITIRGNIEPVRTVPWSTVLRVPTDQGNFFFKAAISSLAHEMSFLPQLAQWRPDCAPQVLAADTQRGWMLMTDAGISLRTLVNGVKDFHHYHEVLCLYAGLQMELSERVPELLALGIPDQRTSALTGLYEQLLTETEHLRIEQPGGLTDAQYQRLQALVPQVPQRCEQLASYGIPASIEHSDFHDNNIFVSDGQYIIIDWGDSSVAHPFMSLLVMLRSVAYHHKLQADAPELTSLRDTYLEQWAAYGEKDKLFEALEIAQQLGMICRTISWKHAINADKEKDGEHQNAVAEWLMDFLDTF